MPSLKATGFDPLFLRNGKQHLTHEYQMNEEGSGLVVRRGQPFRIDFTFTDELDDYDLFFFTISSEDYGAEHLARKWIVKEKPTRFLQDQSDGCPIQILRVLHSQGGKSASVTFTSSASAVVAKYNITGMSIWRDKESIFESEIVLPVYLIFNPFCLRDAVYMEDEAERNEYVLNDNGRVYFGTSRKIGSKPWFFAQFEDPVLACALLLLAKSDLEWDKWGDPVEVSRTMSALVNNLDDDGLLVGNWTGNYHEGVAPTSWKGSHRIIKEYFESQNPVKYGQCWVFSGCMTSLLRTLGIPSRSVTNFDSAHDTDTNLTVDNYFADDFTPLPEHNTDSIWNFHVWNDVWMIRPDLGDQFNGWQAVDATPQEKSKDMYRTGPASLYAIKHGLIELNYDGPFIFAEVNATVKHWIKKEDGNHIEIYSDPNKVGQFISTKAVGSDERMDITDLYKFKEGSKEERETFEEAAKKLNVGDRSDDTGKSRAVTLNINTEEYYEFGHEVTVQAELVNNTDKDQEPLLAIDISLIKYTGAILSKLANARENIKLTANSSEVLDLVIKPEDYITGDVGDEEVSLKVIMALVNGDQKTVKQTEIQLFRPEIEISIAGELAQNKAFYFSCVLPNPLPVTLTNCSFLIDGPGLKGELKEEKIKDVAAGAEAKCSFTLCPLRSGDRKFIASFVCDQVKGIGTEYSVWVEAAD